jgi:hypothetical protein
MEKVEIPYEDIIYLAAHMCDLEEETSPEKIEKVLYDKFNISIDSFHNLCKHLLPLISIGETEGIMFKGLCKNMGFYKVWLIKTPLKNIEITLLKEAVNSINDGTN